jgi:hypothetical protein
MTVYLVYTGQDLESYLQPLQIENTYAPGLEALPTLGWRTMAIDGQGPRHDWHVCREYGGLQIVMRGAIDIGVSAGDLRQVTGRAGDAFLIVDTEGVGHWAHRVGDEPFESFNIRIAPDWEALKSGFSNWPDNVKPFTVKGDGGLSGGPNT